MIWKVIFMKHKKGIENVLHVNFDTFNCRQWSNKKFHETEIICTTSSWYDDHNKNDFSSLNWFLQ